MGPVNHQDAVPGDEEVICADVDMQEGIALGAARKSSALGDGLDHG